jgi:ssDNA thymidine ADP-ribosyltransferase, DarT
MAPIYHITPIGNLLGIVNAGGISCDRLAQGLALVRVGHQHIKDRRMGRPVPVGPGGHIGDYVPFYFAPRSPMLCAIHNGTVAGGVAGQSEVVHLVSSVENVTDAGCQWVFTDGHADMVHLTHFYDDLDHLDKIDWAIMEERYWRDTPTDGDRKRRRQAEFLVHGFFPWELVTEIGVHDRQVADRVREIVGGTEVRLRRGWYY